jgi:hypothetical protein
VAKPRDAWQTHIMAGEAVHPNAQSLTTEEILSEVLTWFPESP